jgi:CheY-like chemotaxis protein
MVNPKPVLVVEDDEQIREALCELLAEAGYRAVGVGNGQEALTYLANGQHPCLIVLDLMMPVMDGWQFRREQQRDPALATIPVLVVTAAGNRTGDELTNVDVIAKPFRMEELMAAIERNCGRPSDS